jgi:hypothetical protein
MKVSTKSLVLTAAFTGLLGGTMARLTAAAPSGNAGNANAGQFVASQLDDKKIEKHACKGKNSCKGNGGCSSGDNGCSGKNSCKGKGGCATDGKSKPKS